MEIQTRGQNTNSLWKNQHTMRITLSQFGSICKATERKDLKSLASNLVSPKSFTCPPVRHGIKYESVAVQLFETMYESDTNECGLFVLKDKPWLAASPDRICCV